MSVLLKAPPHFDFLQFRRALHHVALCAVAAIGGVEVALDTQFDPLRKYVRNPLRGEAWTFAEALRGPEDAPFRVHWPFEGHAGFVAIDLGTTQFLISLLPQADFSEVLTSRSNYQVVGPEQEVPLAAGLTYVEENPPSSTASEV